MAESIARPERHVVVIGAGPAGLTAAYELDRLGVASTVLEASGGAGGISRTVEYRGFRFDIGGHRFFSKSAEIEALWTEILGSEMLERGRLSRILYNKRFFNYPIKPVNALLNLGPLTALACLASYSKAHLFPKRDVRTFEDWTVNAFGRRLYEAFFKTYTEKVWGIPCTEISADWAAQRIKGLSMRSLIAANLRPKSADRANVIKTLIETFRYPARGPGQMWEALCERLTRNGRRVVRQARVVSLERGASGIERVVTADGTGYVPTDVISSMPLRELVEIVTPPAPAHVRSAAAALGYRDFITVALVISARSLFADNWIYIHDDGVKLGRIQNFKNWSPQMVPDPAYTCLGLEYFCFEGDALWNATDAELIALGTRELAHLGLADAATVVDGTVVRQPKAYPVYDDRYREHVATIRAWLESDLPNLQLVGRNGMHRYNNQDHAMMTGLLAARNIANGEHFNLWAVNSDAIYSEEILAGEDSGAGFDG
jgi:protoporphyrinogen oxidase